MTVVWQLWSYSPANGLNLESIAGSGPNTEIIAGKVHDNFLINPETNKEYLTELLIGISSPDTNPLPIFNRVIIRFYPLSSLFYPIVPPFGPEPTEYFPEQLDIGHCADPLTASVDLATFVFIKSTPNLPQTWNDTWPNAPLFTVIIDHVPLTFYSDPETFLAHFDFRLHGGWPSLGPPGTTTGNRAVGGHSQDEFGVQLTPVVEIYYD
jgi:hypothetical protein